MPVTSVNQRLKPVTDDPLIVNISEELSMTDKANSQSPNLVESPLNTSEAIADLAQMLATLEDAEQLAELQTLPAITPASLPKVAKLLPL